MNWRILCELKRFWLFIFLLIRLSPWLCAEGKMLVPADFPGFYVPGYEKEMQLLRELYWLHYPNSGPGATLWDEWMSAPALWPAVNTDGRLQDFRKRWNDALSSRYIDPEGYVSSHQHASVTHQYGWPFPFWAQGSGGAGWHFSFKDTVSEPFRPAQLATPEGWILEGARDEGVGEEGWNIRLTSPNASITTPAKQFVIDVYQAPFLQLRWKAADLGMSQPYVEWLTETESSFVPERRFYFSSPEDNKMVYTMIPVYKHPLWKGKVMQLRICFGNKTTNLPITIQALFTHYDTRHNVNSQSFIRGCANYFWWTGDLNFLRHNINRMRTALQYLMTEHKTLEMNIVFTDWIGHEGRSGLVPQPDGSNKILYGNGIGNNYWDLLPFGYKDCYATLRYYDTLNVMARIEQEIDSHPEWNIPSGIFKHNSDFLANHAAEVKKVGNKLFWNPYTGRFVAAIDKDGKKWDYGFTFLNLEAVHYDFATPSHARKIMSWISGERIVKSDTSQGADIYYWRFAPRSTTKRNLEYYFWGWSAPQSLPWGGQVQDGGAVLGFSYHDLMARLKVKGADDCWRRLQEILRWFGEVQSAGGYRNYYKDRHNVTLQGCGTAGALGLDCEFVESVLVPQIMLDGFLGFRPAGDGFFIKPQLPNDWSELTIDRIAFHDLILKITATHRTIEIFSEGIMNEPCHIFLAPGNWIMTTFAGDGSIIASSHVFINKKLKSVLINWNIVSHIRFEKQK